MEMPPDVVARTDQCAAWTADVLNQAMLNQVELIEQFGTTATLHGRLQWATEMVEEHPDLAAQLISVAVHVAALAHMHRGGDTL